MSEVYYNNLLRNIKWRACYWIGEIDVASADVFEKRFDFDLGNANVSSGLSLIDDEILGTIGDDIFAPNQGNDVITGGGGNDLFIFADNNGKDLIFDFGLGDLIDLREVSSITSFLDVQAAAVDDGAGNASIDLGEGNNITLIGVAPSALEAESFIV